MNTIELRRPDDWHLHLRDGEMLKGVTRHSADTFARAIIMPNLVPPLTTVDAVKAYRSRVEAAVPTGRNFTPLMTLYLTDNTSPDEIRKGHEENVLTAVKLYPAGATTNSDSGVTNIEAVYPVLETMADIGMPLCVHGEVTASEVDIFDREAVFIDTVLDPLRQRIPNLKIVMEHVTTQQGVDYVSQSSGNLAATVTTHHLIINRNAILAGGIRPHYYCLPVAKRETHRLALRKAATSGDNRFFLGTDSAPHTDPAKETACGCAGIFTSINTLNCLAHVFEEENALDKLEAFCSLNGPAFYGLEPNEERITLARGSEPVEFPEKIDTGDGSVTVFDPQFPLYWKVVMPE